ncbi:vWA domain-containing protein [Fulvivirga lutea]|uniref:VWA domain-containing protein n=1 Tax=Fulvivirga lutea TaxID=2810512 RepID=A0A974WIC1_9BACT|nr:VWA domain-containing protein [Fulvivirga lutea]QSE99089.1 VWA domain-containing protein [Fulvivirga lutea]
MVEQSTTLPWYSIQNFYPGILQGYSWENSLALYGILAIPLFFIIRWAYRYFFNQKLPVAFTRSQVISNPLTIVRLVPDFIMMLIVALLIVALARPQKTNEKVVQWTEGIDIMLVIDISQSMQIEDFTPNRLEAAKQVAKDFIDGRLQDRIGLVIFSGDAYSLSPLTTDYDLLKTYIDDINFDMIENRGTAIGSALAVATNRMTEMESKSKVCILLSDGDNTAGNIDPITAAKLASAYDIKTYTIAIGKEGKVPFGKDFFGRPRMVENTMDETTLREIAKIGSGQFFRASDNQALENVFKQIDQYEKAEIQETRFKDTTDFYRNYIMWALVLFLFWVFLKSTFISNILQD